jgi:hypothetical protein
LRAASAAFVACLVLAVVSAPAAPWKPSLPEPLAAEWEKVRASGQSREAVALVERRLSSLATAVSRLETRLTAVSAVPFADLLDRHGPAGSGQAVDPGLVFGLLRPEFPTGKLAATKPTPRVKLVLLDVLRQAVADANRRLAMRTLALATAVGQQADSAVQLTLVLPFLCIDDTDWGAEDAQCLPPWLVARLRRTGSAAAPAVDEPARKACVHFALSLGRVKSAWGLHLVGRQVAPGESLVGFLEKTGLALLASGDCRTAGACLSAGAARAEAAGDAKTAARLRLSLARSMARLGSPGDAAKEALRTVRNCPDPAMARRAALARILYLFQDGQFAQVCDEAAAYGKKPELAACRARLLYARWLASLRLGRSTEEQSLRATFLAEFPDDPMVPKMLYCLLCRALAGGDPDQAAGYMDRIEKRYPQSEATAHVREIRRAMAQERGDGAGREQGH